ncbi:MAG: transcriptional regulator PhoU [Methanomassiliicoccales archaeon PtaB.Bin134]|jgi:phosphate transport system protein|nr:MAG: transcriptional regulator PhoU [Methanomassiliicoccales archaeon PtaB.Bin134]
MTPRTTFNHEMEELSKEITEMANASRTAFEKAVLMIADMDFSLREEVRALDRRIYELNEQIDRHCLDIIALHSPVAGDLRMISACLKMVEDLNRFGRYAMDIAELIDDFEEGKAFKRFESLRTMSCLVVGIVDDAVYAFLQRDAVKASQLHERDDAVDSLYDAIFREILTYMMEDPRKITVGIDLILVARYMERVADHACNIGEYVYHMVTGQRLDPKLRTGNVEQPPCRIFEHPEPRSELDLK